MVLYIICTDKVAWGIPYKFPASHYVQYKDIEISFVGDIHFSNLIIMKFCTECINMIFMLCTKCEGDWGDEKVAMDLTLRMVLFGFF